MPAPILHLHDITYSLGGRPLLNGTELSVNAEQRVCLVGRNGSGKSTLLKIAAGLLQPDRGTVFVQPGVKVYYLAQEPDLSSFSTTLDYVQSSLDATQSYRARALLSELGLSGQERCHTLSGGEARRCALARALAEEPDLLLLDEPTNHLDLPSIAWLERELLASRCAMVVISHDRRLLETLSRSVVWLEQGTTRRLDQGFERYEEWRDSVLETEERDAHKLSREIAREEDWMRYGVTARRKRNVRRVAELAALKEKRRDHASQRRGVLRMEANASESGGKITVSAENLTWAYGERTLIDCLNLRIMRGDRLGLIGANGAGKTTLIHLLTGRLSPQKGQVWIGPSVSMVTLDQQRESLDSNKTLADTLTGGHGDHVLVGEEKRHVIGYMKDFLFRPEQARTPVGHLSGGERGRLALACALAKPSNLMVLDEPTNDLDLETLDLLQDMLADYPGTVLLVSHDRDFLDRVATSVLLSEGEGRWVEYAGGYSDMLVQKRDEKRDQKKAPTEPSANSTAQEARKKDDKHLAKTEKTKTKLSYNDKRTLERLPSRISQLENDIRTLRDRLSDASFYTRDPSGFETATRHLAESERALDEAEAEWLALEIKREELEAR